MGTLPFTRRAIWWLPRAMRAASADAYAAWAPAYASCPHNSLMAVEQAAMLALLPPVRERLVLDAGAGTGRYARLALARGARAVVAIDRSEAMLARAAPGTGRVRADAAHLPISTRSIDVIVSGLMLPDVADLRAVVTEWHRVLRRGGVLVCSTLHPRGAQEGWSRTFDTPQGPQTLTAQWHTVADIQSACAHAGLTLADVAEPRLTGKGPVALVCRAHRAD